ncbi:MAG: hypothetical protein ACQER7_09935 [Bacteroidota bacterium]
MTRCKSDGRINKIDVIFIDYESVRGRTSSTLACPAAGGPAGINTNYN